MDKGLRVAVETMTWTKRNGDLVVCRRGEEFFCFGDDGKEAGKCLVAVQMKHMFLSSIESIEARSQPAEESCPKNEHV